jgi:hypothetical protein
MFQLFNLSISFCIVLPLLEKNNSSLSHEKHHVCWLNLVGRTLASVDLERLKVFGRALAGNWVEHPVLQKHSPHWDVLYVITKWKNT